MASIAFVITFRPPPIQSHDPIPRRLLPSGQLVHRQWLRQGTDLKAYRATRLVLQADEQNQRLKIASLIHSDWINRSKFT